MSAAAAARARRAFADAFGGAPALVARAPGRVNLIGEHTDYNEGFVLPAAIGADTCVAARARGDGRIRAVAADYPGPAAAFATAAAFTRGDAPGWEVYLRAMAAALAQAGRPVPGAEIAIAGDIPRGAGLSSSASLCVALGTALAALAEAPLDANGLAAIAQAAENDFVGVRCGIMDQLASAHGIAGHAVLIDCRTRACRPVAMPGDAAILIVHSGVERGLVAGEYNARRRQCERAAEKLGAAALRDVDAAALAAAGPRLTPLELARAHHVVSENARVLAAAEALAAGELAALGGLMAASHASMRDDFAISHPAVDALVAELTGLIGGNGGARMTGGGFGGAVVALVPTARADAILAALTYRTPTGAPPLTLIAAPAAGAGLL